MEPYGSIFSTKEEMMMTNTRIVTFGELLLRFSKPERLRLTQGDIFTSKYGGSEANVAVSLATLGNCVDYVTRLPETPVGLAGIQSLQSLGVSCRHVLRGGRRIGTYYMEPPAGMRPPKVIYDRDVRPTLTQAGHDSLAGDSPRGLGAPCVGHHGSHLTAGG